MEPSGHPESVQTRIKDDDFTTGRHFGDLGTFWHQFGTHLVCFGWPWATFLAPFHGICAWPWPGLASSFGLFCLTLCGLNLDTNLHEVFVKASWYSVKASWYSTNSFLMLLRDCFFVCPWTFAVHNSFMVFHKSRLVFHTSCLVFLGASRYYTEASRYSSNQYSLRVRSSLRL